MFFSLFFSDNFFSLFSITQVTHSFSFTCISVPYSISIMFLHLAYPAFPCLTISPTSLPSFPFTAPRGLYSINLFPSVFSSFPYAFSTSSDFNCFCPLDLFLTPHCLFPSSFLSPSFALRMHFNTSSPAVLLASFLPLSSLPFSHPSSFPLFYLLIVTLSLLSFLSFPISFLCFTFPSFLHAFFHSFLNIVSPFLHIL